MGYKLHDPGAHEESAIYHKIISKLTQDQPSMEPGKSSMAKGLTLYKLLPRTDCKECGKRNCMAFAIDLAKGKLGLEGCPVLATPEYESDRLALAKLI